jgi:hypothetical protein
MTKLVVDTLLGMNELDRSSADLQHHPHIQQSRQAATSWYIAFGQEEGFPRSSMQALAEAARGLLATEDRPPPEAVFSP